MRDIKITNTEKSKEYSESTYLTDVKAHLRIDSGDTQYDDYITECIIDAFDDAENYCECDIVQTTGITTIKNYTGYNIIIKESPLISITSVSYVDGNGDTITLTENTDFQVEKRNSLFIIYLENLLDTDQIVITYLTGFSSIPKSIIRAMKVIVADYFDEERNNYGLTNLRDLKAVQRLLNPHKRIYY